MTRISSDRVNAKRPAGELFEFLDDVSNFERIMPDRVSHFESHGDSFTFGLKGMPEVRLKKTESHAPSHILLESEGGKIDFSLRCHIEEEGEKTYCQLFFEGDFNPMVKMMAEKPLGNFIAKLADKISEL